MTHQTIYFMLQEIAAPRFYSDAPATTSMMGDFTSLDYAAMAPHLDFISWDAYPQWGKGAVGDDIRAACCDEPYECPLEINIRWPDFLKPVGFLYLPP